MHPTGFDREVGAFNPLHKALLPEVEGLSDQQRRQVMFAMIPPMMPLGLVPDHKDRSTQVWMAAWYENDFVRSDGQWLISHLRYRDRFVCPYDQGWAKVRCISPQTLEITPEPEPD